MPATEPEQIHGLFEQAFNAGDIEALMALYEPDAALVPQPGAIAEASAAIRESLRWFLDRRGRISLETKLVLRVGDRLPRQPLCGQRRHDARREPRRTRSDPTPPVPTEYPDAIPRVGSNLPRALPRDLATPHERCHGGAQPVHDAALRNCRRVASPASARAVDWTTSEAR